MKTNTIFVVFSIVLLNYGCATHHQMITSDNASNSRVEIDYVLGHSRYQYIAAANKNGAEISSHRDGKALESRTISMNRYQEFVEKIEKTWEYGSPEIVDECRTPYKIQILADGKEKAISGCRSTEMGKEIGQIIKEGEFLFYSKEASGQDD